jgi:hypothetical protein
MQQAFNGVFIDRANWANSDKCNWDAATCTAMGAAQTQLFVELTAALGPGNITLAKETSGEIMQDWKVANVRLLCRLFFCCR